VLLDPLFTASLNANNGTGEVSIPATLRIGVTPPIDTILDVTIQKTTIAAPSGMSIRNTNTTMAGSNAQLSIAVGSGGSGGLSDPVLYFNIASSQTYAVGLDNSDSDKFKMSASNALGTTDVFTSTSAGVITLPLQPMFHAELQTSDFNQTGLAAIYTLGSGNALALQQQGTPSGIATNGIFTAPVAGVYSFSYCIQATAITGGMTNGRSWFLFSPGGAIKQGSCFNPAVVVNVGANPSVTFTGSTVIVLPAMGTVRVQLQIINGAGDTATISGSLASAGNGSWFSGVKIA
jgi:hypothetical protein